MGFLAYPYNFMITFRFEQNFGVVVYEYFYGFWDASDVSDPYNSSQVLDDLAQDAAWLVSDENYIVIGWCFRALPVFS
jgi:hypothetical protein